MYVAHIVYDGDDGVARLLLPGQGEQVPAAGGAGEGHGHNVRIAGLYGGEEGIVGGHLELVGAVAAKGVGVYVAAHGVAAVPAARGVAAGTGAAAAVGIILITVVRVHIAGNAGHGAEAGLPHHEILGKHRPVHAVMGHPAVVLVQPAAGKAAVVQSGGTVQGHVIAALFNGGAEGLHNVGHGAAVHISVVGRFNVVKNRVVQLAAVQNVQAEFSLSAGHLRRGGIAEMVHAHVNAVGHGPGVIFRKALVHLVGPVFPAVPGADDGEVHQAAVGHGVPVNVALVVRHVNAHERHVYLAAGVAAVGKVGGYGGNAVAYPLHVAVAYRGHRGIAGAPPLHVHRAAGRKREQRVAFSGAQGDHGVAEVEAGIRRNGEDGNPQDDGQRQNKGEQFFAHENSPPFLRIVRCIFFTIIKGNPRFFDKICLCSIIWDPPDYVKLTGRNLPWENLARSAARGGGFPGKWGVLPSAASKFTGKWEIFQICNIFVNKNSGILFAPPL